MTHIISTALSKIYGGTSAPLVAQSLAREVLKNSGLKTPPFDPFMIAKALKISIAYEPIAGAEGVLKNFRSPNPEIALAEPTCDYVSPRYRKRMNFTVAHEIGHFAI